jgi:N-acetylmuramoyl-L-alanine amidase
MNIHAPVTILAATMCMCGCDVEPLHAAEPKFPEWVEWTASPHHSERRAEQVTAIIYHYTAGGSLRGTVKWFQNADSKVSAHYVIGKDGTVVQMVALDRAAWHAGTSVLAGVEGVNHFSIGFEIVNWGKLTRRDGKFFTYTGSEYQGPEPIAAESAFWEPYTDAQYRALIRLTTALLDKYPIRHLTGHSDVATPKGRKIDPGPAFDWPRIKTALPDAYRGQVGPLSR